VSTLALNWHSFHFWHAGYLLIVSVPKASAYKKSNGT
jgi:hypothetical protein